MRGSAKLNPTSSIIPPVAGTTPRSIACTTGKCCTDAKPTVIRQVMVALGSNKPAREMTMPQAPPSLRPIRTVRATRLIPGVRIHKFQSCVNSSIDNHLCFSINARCINNVVVAPPPKDCSPMLAQIRKSCHLPGLGSCSLICLALVQGHEAHCVRSGVIGFGTDQAVVADLFQDVSGPACCAADSEGGCEEITREPNRGQQHGGIKLYVGVEAATWLLLL